MSTTGKLLILLLSSSLFGLIQPTDGRDIAFLELPLDRSQSVDTNSFPSTFSVYKGIHQHHHSAFSVESIIQDNSFSYREILPYTFSPLPISTQYGSKVEKYALKDMCLPVREVHTRYAVRLIQPSKLPEGGIKHQHGERTLSLGHEYVSINHKDKRC